MKYHDYILPGAVLLGIYFLVTSKNNWANPSSTDNILYGAANAIGDVFDDGEDNDSFNLGAKIFFWLNPEAAGGWHMTQDQKKEWERGEEDRIYL